ncbi:hypothetical protein CCP3SC5AM1_210028 [Gammaproteobacteria bacterium]
MGTLATGATVLRGDGREKPNKAAESNPALANVTASRITDAEKNGQITFAGLVEKMIDRGDISVRPGLTGIMAFSNNLLNFRISLDFCNISLNFDRIKDKGQTKWLLSKNPS